jgi:hypothetical protein
MELLIAARAVDDRLSPAERAAWQLLFAAPTFRPIRYNGGISRPATGWVWLGTPSRLKTLSLLFGSRDNRYWYDAMYDDCVVALTGFSAWAAALRLAERAAVEAVLEGDE